VKITEIRIRDVEDKLKLKAYATVTFDGEFVIHNIKIIENENGIFVTMPSRKTRDGEYKDIAHPICANFRSYLQDEIVLRYNEEKGRLSAGHE
jgi:stage V sporulation protein G